MICVHCNNTVRDGIRLCPVCELPPGQQADQLYCDYCPPDGRCIVCGGIKSPPRRPVAAEHCAADRPTPLLPQPDLHGH